MEARECILQGQTALGIEFGSTRIKAVLIDQDGKVLAKGVTAGKIPLNRVFGPTIWKTFIRGCVNVIVICANMCVLHISCR